MEINRDLFEQNPGYMRDNFIIIIESLHLADVGDQENVSFFLLLYCYIFLN